MNLKLYVWHDVLYGWNSGIMFALAHNVDEARQLLRKAWPYLPDSDLEKEPEIYDSPYADYIYGGD